MGTWDVGIFDNDTAADVRGLYAAALRQDAERAARAVLDAFAEDLADSDVAPDIWLGLAAAQWDAGRPDPSIVARAVAIIDDGSDLARWRELGASEDLVAGRAAVLQELRARLSAAAPPVNQLEADIYVAPPTSLRIGDVFVYELPSGRLVAMVVIQVASTDFGSAPVCVFAQRALAHAPSPDEVMHMQMADDPFGVQQTLVAHWNDQPMHLGEVPENVKDRAAMLLLVHESPEDEAHERARVRVVGHVELALALVGHLDRVPWSGLAAYLAEHFDVG